MPDGLPDYFEYDPKTRLYVDRWTGRGFTYDQAKAIAQDRSLSFGAPGDRSDWVGMGNVQRFGGYSKQPGMGDVQRAGSTAAYGRPGANYGLFSTMSSGRTLPGWWSGGALGADALVPTSAAQTDRGRWKGMDYGWWEGNNPRAGVLGDPWGYGLTEGQLEPGYTPGASERNAFGQPLGTPGPLRVRGPRRDNAYARQHQGPGQAGDTWRTDLRKDGGDAHNWLQKRDRPKPKKKKPQGVGVTPAWVSGMAQLNI